MQILAKNMITWTHCQGPFLVLWRGPWKWGVLRLKLHYLFRNYIPGWNNKLPTSVASSNSPHFVDTHQLVGSGSEFDWSGVSWPEGRENLATRSHSGIQANRGSGIFNICLGHEQLAVRQGKRESRRSWGRFYWPAQEVELHFFP